MLRDVLGGALRRDNLVFGRARTDGSNGARVASPERQIGTDISIVGYDDLPFSRFTEPPLTTVRQPIRETGHELVNILLARLADATRPPVIEVWQPELILRATHGPAPTRSTGVPP